MLFDTLRKSLSGEVRDDPLSRAIYSTDASLYEIEPQCVVVPQTEEDILRVVEVAREFHVAISTRGAGTGTAGGCLGSGIILDCSKYLKRIDAVAEHLVRCQPGVVQDDLNRAVSPLRLGPSISTGNRATIGGMWANNASGSDSLLYGPFSKHIHSARVITGKGEILETRFISLSELKKSTSPLLQKLLELRIRYKEAIEKYFPKFQRRVTGYNLDALIDKEGIDLNRLLAGSEGTLAILTEITLKLVRPIPNRTLGILLFDSIEEALRAVPDLLKTEPLALELIDKIILQGRPLSFLEEAPGALLAVEYADGASADFLSLNKEEAKELWEARRAGLETLLSRRSYKRAAAFIEDIAAPPEKLADFYLELKALIGGETSFYGHAGEGCLHVRPFIDLRTEREKIPEIQRSVARLLKKYGGVMSGEHGDGLVRSYLTPELFHPDLISCMEEIKRAFDPDNILNPGKVVFGKSPLENLRSIPESSPPTFLDFSKEGGFALSVDLCNGNGLCRKREGLMCPSYQATHEESAVTRGRASALRALLRGTLKPLSFDNPHLREVMSLCLSCKGCKKECPTSVDMAKMKMEVLYHAKKSWKDRLFGHLPKLLSFLRFFGKRSFTSWFHAQKFPKHGKEVALFVDSFTNFLEPENGKAFVKIAHHLGYNVHLIPYSCCGRTLLSRGMLEEAKEKAKETALLLKQYEMPIVCLEPSCNSAVNDDYEGLLGETGKLLSLDQFLIQEKAHLPHGSFFVQRHCHDKALDVPHYKGKEIPSGCCGMAGAFGYEQRSLSKKIGELILFPFIRKLPRDTPLIANGFSCRSQIKRGTGRRAVHLARYLFDFIEKER